MQLQYYCFIAVSLASFHQITKLVFLTCVQSTVLAHLSEEVCVVSPLENNTLLWSMLY